MPQTISSDSKLFLIAAYFGVIAGLLEGSVFFALRLIPEGLTWKMRLNNVSAEIFWIAPLFNVFLFVTVAFLLTLVIGGIKKLYLVSQNSAEVLGVFLFASMSFYAPIKITDRIFSWAACLLALGLSAQLCRWWQAQPRRAMKMLRQTFKLSISLVILMVLVTIGGERFKEYTRVRNLPPAPTGAASVLLIVLDTVRADHLSSYGYNRLTTPEIDKIVEQGAVFEHAIATSSWTPPNHASLMTGRHVYEHGVGGGKPVLSKRYRTLAEFMAEQGYATAGVSANTMWVTGNSGFDRGFIHFEDYFCSLADMVARTAYGKEIAKRVRPYFGYRDILGRKTAEDINSAFLRWLDATERRPFFAFLNYMDAHAPYLSPFSYHTRFMDQHQRARETEYPFNPGGDSDGSSEFRELQMAAYDGALAFLDSQIGKLSNELQRRGLLDSTLVVITSDHGEMFGEHGFFQHGHSLYRPLIQVPLIFRFPRDIQPGLRVPEPVSLRDIPITITSLLFPNVSSPFPGRSLAGLLQNTMLTVNAESEPILSELISRDWLPRALPVSRGWIKSLVTSRWHFVLHQSGRIELYDVKNDRNEVENLAARPIGREVVKNFKQQLQAMIPDISARK